MDKQHRKIAVFFWSALFVTCVVSLFDLLLISPIHEGGHLLGCSILGIKVLRLTWTGVKFVPVSDWRQNVVGSMGGITAAVVVCLIYVLLTHSRLSRMVSKFPMLTRAILVTDIMVQITSAVLEGSSLPMYHQVFGLVPFAFVITWGFSSFSVSWQSRKNLSVESFGEVDRLHPH